MVIFNEIIKFCSFCLFAVVFHLLEHVLFVTLVGACAPKGQFIISPGQSDASRAERHPGEATRHDPPRPANLLPPCWGQGGRRFAGRGIFGCIVPQGVALG
ncbi:hypothetical protein BHU11_05165 [Tannerella sp. oral taxon 808]|nr:hypothetical protein BHU11_05165 [Tannerella sp. oral taxon 808]